MDMQKSVQKISSLARDILKGDIRVVFEMGANDCEDTIGFAGEFPSATIYAFECNPATIPLDKKKIGSFKNIVFIEKAISDKEGPLTFFPTTNGNTGASSLFKESGEYPVETYNQREVVVDATTISAFVAERGIRGIDILWMDMQGAELMELKGSGDFIDKIKIIHAEAEFMEVYKGQPLFKEFRKYLESHGFVLYGFTHFGRYSCDAIFINQALPISPLRKNTIYPFWAYFWKYISFAMRKLGSHE